MRRYKPIQGPHSTIHLLNFAYSHLSCVTKILAYYGGSIGYRFGQSMPGRPSRSISAGVGRYLVTIKRPSSNIKPLIQLTSQLSFPNLLHQTASEHFLHVWLLIALQLIIKVLSEGPLQGRSSSAWGTVSDSAKLYLSSRPLSLS